MRAACGALLIALTVYCTHAAAATEATDVGSADLETVTLTGDSISSVVGGKLPVLVSFGAPWCGRCKALAPHWEELAGVLGDKAVVGTLDGEEYPDAKASYGVDGYPTMLFFGAGSTAAERYTGPRDVQSLVKFASQKMGLQLKYKPPRDPVRTLTGDELSDLVKGGKHHLLVQFFAPWCGHCKKLSPAYKKLAESFAGEDEVVIARLDADKYRQTSIDHGVNGYPTLLWFTKGDQRGEIYDEERTPEGMVSFVNHKAGTERAVGGLAFSAGRIKSLDNVARKFRKAGAKKRSAIIEQVQEALKTGAHGIEGHKNNKYAKFYLQAMESEPLTLQKEVERLERLRASGDVHPRSRDDITKRLNIFHIFT